MNVQEIKEEGMEEQEKWMNYEEQERCKNGAAKINKNRQISKQVGKIKINVKRRNMQQAKISKTKDVEI